MISKVVSMDIVKYLREDQKLSVSDVAASMNTTVSHIVNVINKKELFTPEDIDAYINSSGLHCWEFMIKAIPLNHLPEKTKKKLLLCKEISDHLNKKNRKK
jgi:hypothetical protein